MTTTRAEAALEKVVEDAKNMDVLKKQQAKLQTKTDADVLRARKAGLKYREISEASGRSVAWVQSTLARAGYEPEKRASAKK